MRDHLIGKNVASEVADNLCQSVASKLEGKVLGKSFQFKAHKMLSQLLFSEVFSHFP